jgi:MFS family permease
VLLVGVLGLVELAALLAFAMLGGALADARDRRMLVLLTEVGLMVGSGILAVNAFLPRPLVWLVFVIASLSGAIDALQRPALTALGPRLVDRDELPAAAALNSMRSTLGMVAGPAVAGRVPRRRPDLCGRVGGPVVDESGAAASRRRAAERPAGARGSPLRAQPPGTVGHVSD